MWRVGRVRCVLETRKGRVTVVSLTVVFGGDRRMWKDGRKDDGEREGGRRKEVEGKEGVVNDFD